MDSTSLILGGLGGLALALGYIYTPVRRLRTATRTFYRRLIGMTRFEELVIDEMRTYRSDVDNFTRQVRSEMRTLRSEMQAGRNTLSAHGARVNSTKREVEELGIMLDSYTETLGPIWNTAQGHRMPMRLLSTGHLENIIEGGFGSYEARDFARVELERRGIDASWRVRQERGEPAPTKEQMAARRAMKARSEELVRQQAPFVKPKKKRALSFDERRRVRAVLPMWAQDLINELVNE